MKVRTFYIYLSLLSSALSVSYLAPLHSMLSLLAPLASLFMLASTDTIKLRWRILLLIPIIVSTYFNIYSIFPLVIYSIAIYLLSKGKLTYSRALYSSVIASFAFPLAAAISSYNLLVAPLITLQASGLAIVKETIYLGKRPIGIIAYSIPFVILLYLTFGRWIEMITIISIAIWVFGKVGREVLKYESVLKALTIFSISTFVSYVLPIYIAEINFNVFQYFIAVTGF